MDAVGTGIGDHQIAKMYAEEIDDIVIDSLEWIEKMMIGDTDSWSAHFLNLVQELPKIDKEAKYLVSKWVAKYSSARMSINQNIQYFFSITFSVSTDGYCSNCRSQWNDVCVCAYELCVVMNWQEESESLMNHVFSFWRQSMVVIFFFTSSMWLNRFW